MIIHDEILHMKEEFLNLHQTSSPIWNYCKRNPIPPRLIFFSIQNRNISEQWRTEKQLSFKFKVIIHWTLEFLHNKTVTLIKINLSFVLLRKQSKLISVFTRTTAAAGPTKAYSSPPSRESQQLKITSDKN